MSRMGKEFWGLAKRIAMMVEKLIFGAGGSKVRRGRPRKYENWEVILALMVKNRERLPYRKVEVLVGRVRNVDIVVRCRVGKAYADENKLLEEILRGVKYRTTYFLGDRYYNKNKVIRMVRERNIVPVIPTENTIRKRVRRGGGRRRCMRSTGIFTKRGT